ncbi:DNA primase [Candidatus Bathyarchaeota archaeon]|nr:MAG: DNA primase [Candidatus Bathyarchaeota archaeon]
MEDDWLTSSITPTAKYVIHAKFEVNGIVEKPDVIGAIFGQTEGLFGPELDLKELQKNNRIGRIEVEVKTEHNKSYGTITVSSSLSKAATAILAAAIESVERVGPWEAKVQLEKIEDLREVKRRQIIRRAKEILKKWTFESVPETDEILREISDVLKPSEIVTYGPEQLPAGPDVDSAQSIIVVEGRADVHNLLRCGIKNVIAIEGAKIPETIVRLSKEKQVTVFLDGDRAGDLILKELLQTVDVKYVARAPPRKEVEELTCKEIMTALREKIPASDVRMKYARIHVPSKIIDIIENLKGTLEAVLLNDKLEILARVPVSELAEKLPSVEDVSTVVFDGIITQRLVDLAEDKGVKYLIGDKISELNRRPVKPRLLTFEDVAPESPAGI